MPLDWRLPARIQEPLEVFEAAAPRQQIRHYQTVSTIDKAPFVIQVPTGVYWILKSLIIVYNAGSVYGQRSVNVTFFNANLIAQNVAFAASSIVNRNQQLIMTLLPRGGSSDTETTGTTATNGLTCMRSMPDWLGPNYQVIIRPWNTISGEAIQLDLEYVEVAQNG
jgi:hypothetical protein